MVSGTEAAAFPRLFAPLALRRRAVKNRIVSTSHDANLGERGVPGERYIRYQVEKARGGVGLVQCFGATSVHPSSPLLTHGGIANWDESIVPPFRALADEVHVFGALVTCQLVHTGRRASSLGTRQPVIAPWDEPNERTGETPRVMTVADIRMVLDAYAAAAERTCRAGFDGVELAIFGDMLPDQFLSPQVNRRTDEYGGTLERRLRFPTELVRAVREAIGSDHLLFVRLSAEDFIPGELTPAERVEVARHLQDLRAVDVFSITAGTVKTLKGRPHHVPSAYFPHGVYLDLVRPFRRVIRAPIIYAGRIVRPEEAEAVLAEGLADLIGMTRAIIADPELPRKAAEGRVGEIRLCVGANEGCIGRLYQNLPIECIQNPAIGREAELTVIRPASVRRRVVVVGGGPAGLEAARVAALRGHRVILLEQDDTLGGQVLLAARAPGREEFSGIVRWLEYQVRRLGVEVHLGVTVAPGEVLALEPEAVVIATGSRPRSLRADVSSEAHVASPQDVLQEQIRPGRRVVVIAEDTHMIPPTTAHFLAARGHIVTVLTPAYGLGEMIDDTLRPVVLQRLFESGVEVVPLHRALRITSAEVVAEHVLTGRHTVFPADSIVGACGAHAHDPLSQALAPSIASLDVIGDALAPRRVHVAILEGTRVGRSL